MGCFDTAFHRTRRRSPGASAAPRAVRPKASSATASTACLRYVARQLPGSAGRERPAGAIIIAHLGNGASMCALNDGKSRDTTMGFTAVDGLMMGTHRQPRPRRDPPPHRAEGHGRQAAVQPDLQAIRPAGRLRLSQDMRALLESDEDSAKEAIELFCYRAACMIGRLSMAAGGLEALVFTGGIGEHAAPIPRPHRRVARMDRPAPLPGRQPAPRHAHHTKDSKVEVLVVPTNEEWMISHHAVNPSGWLSPSPPRQSPGQSKKPGSPGLFAGYDDRWISAAGRTNPSGRRRPRGQPDGLRGSPTPPGTGHDARHRRRRPCPRWSDSSPRRRWSPSVGGVVLVDTEGVEQRADRVGEAHRQEGRVAGQLSNSEPATSGHLAVLPVEADSLERLHVALAVIDEALGRHRESRQPSSWEDGVRSLYGQYGQVSALFSDSGGIGISSNWVTGRTVAVGGAHAVGTSVAAADHDDVLAGLDEIGLAIPCWTSLFCGPEFPRRNALRLTARDRQVTRGTSEPAARITIELGLELVGGDDFGGVVVDAGGRVLVADHTLVGRPRLRLPSARRGGR